MMNTCCVCQPPPLSHLLTLFIILFLHFYFTKLTPHIVPTQTVFTHHKVPLFFMFMPQISLFSIYLSHFHMPNSLSSHVLLTLLRNHLVDAWHFSSSFTYIFPRDSLGSRIPLSLPCSHIAPNKSP